MAEKEKQEKKAQEEKPAKTEVVEKKEEKKEKQKKAPKPVSNKPNHKKLTRMNLIEVNEALQGVQEHMGDLHSAYAKSLLERKAILENHSPEPLRKAA